MKAEARIAALEAENQQLKARAEKAEHTTDAFIRRLDAEIERCDKAEAALRRQRGRGLTPGLAGGLWGSRVRTAP